MKKKPLTLPVPDTRRSLNLQTGRWWFVTDSGQLVRGLSWTNYEPCFYSEFPIEYTMRLNPDDPRPLGRRIYHKLDIFTPEYVRSLAEWYLEHHPIGVWCTTDFAEPREVPPYRDFTALMVIEQRKAS